MRSRPSGFNLKSFFFLGAHVCCLFIVTCNETHPVAKLALQPESLKNLMATKIVAKAKRVSRAEKDLKLSKSHINITCKGQKNYWVSQIKVNKP